MIITTKTKYYMGKASKFDDEESIINQGISEYEKPSNPTAEFEIGIRNPLYGKAIYIPMPTSEKNIQAAINAVSGNGQFDWETVDTELINPFVDQDMLRAIGLSDLYALNDFAALLNSAEPFQIAWAYHYCDYSGDKLNVVLPSILNAKGDRLAMYDKALDTRYFKDNDLLFTWYLNMMPLDYLPNYADKSAMDDLLVSNKIISRSSLNDPERRYNAIIKFINKFGKSLFIEKYLWNAFNVNKIMSTIEIGDWFVSAQDEHGYYIFESDRNAP